MDSNKFSTFPIFAQAPTGRIYITSNGLSDSEGEPPNPLEVFHCELWISNFCKPQKSINAHAYSYSLKHYAENWRSDLPSDCKYVSNGALIQAAVNLGYRYVRNGHGLNANFNMYISKSAKAAV